MVSLSIAVLFIEPAGAQDAGIGEEQEPSAGESSRKEKALADDPLEWEVAPEPEVEPGPPEPDTDPARSDAPSPPPDLPVPDIQWSVGWRKGIELRRSDGLHRLQFGGRLILDGGLLHTESRLGLASRSWTREGKVRQGRLFGQGLVYRRFLFKADFEFVDQEFRDVFVGMRKLGPVGTVKFGYLREPISLEQSTGFLNLTFMERSLANALVPKRNLGLLATNTLFGDRLRWALGAFKLVESFQEADQLGSGFDDDWDLAARITGVVFERDEGRELLVAGVSVVHTIPVDTAEVSFSTRAESFLSGRVLSTGPIPEVRGADRVGLEAAWVDGPFMLQGETIFATLRRKGSADLLFGGGYLQASWFLTGEHRIYGKQSGVFARVLPEEDFEWGRGGGAVELAGRVSYLDLDDEDVRGGRALDLTLGANWYLLSNLKLATNVVWSRVIGEGNVFIGQLRFQVDF